MHLRLGQITKNVTWLVAGEALVKGGVLAIVAVVARGMGAAALGVFTVALGAAMVAVPLLTCGQAEVLIRDVARSHPSARPLLTAARRGQYRVIALALPVAVAAAALIADHELRATLFAFFPYVLLRVEAFTRGAAFKGLDRMDVEVRTRGAELGLAVLLVAAFTLAGAPVWSAAAAMTLGSAAAVLWLIRLQATLPAALRTPAPPTSALRRGAPFLGLAVNLQLLLRADTLLAAGLGVAKDEIGYYGAAAGLVWGLLALPQLFAIALYPTFSRQAAGGRGRATAAAVAATVGTAAGLAVATGLWALRAILLELLFGPEFIAATAFLGRLAWALPGASAAMVLGVVVAAWHRQGWALALSTVTVLLSLGLNLAWIPRAGLLGAANVAVVVHSFAAAGGLVLALWPARANR